MINNYLHNAIVQYLLLEIPEFADFVCEWSVELDYNKFHNLQYNFGTKPNGQLTLKFLPSNTDIEKNALPSKIKIRVPIEYLPILP